MTSTATPTASDSMTPTPMWWQRNARRVWLVVKIAVALAVAAGVGWWWLLSPVAVTAHIVQLGEVSAEVRGTGTLEARVGAIVGPKMAGLIARIAVDQGDRVKAGEGGKTAVSMARWVNTHQEQGPRSETVSV